jgi:hypothetical protein
MVRKAMTGSVPLNPALNPNKPRLPVDTLPPTLHSLLDANARFALDARGTTNHCPMALVALARMGAAPDRLQAFFAHWSERYAILETQPCTAIPDGDSLAQVGNRTGFSSLRGYFLDAISRDGAPATIAEVLRRAPQAPATGAFHALIRIGYGIEAGHAGEIAAGLAAYVAANLPVAIDGAGSGAAASVEAGFAHLSRHLADRDWPLGSITGRLEAIAADPVFRRELQAAPAGPRLLDTWRGCRSRCIGRARTSPCCTWSRECMPRGSCWRKCRRPCFIQWQDRSGRPGAPPTCRSALRRSPQSIRQRLMPPARTCCKKRSPRMTITSSRWPTRVSGRAGAIRIHRFTWRPPQESFDVA